MSVVVVGLREPDVPLDLLGRVAIAERDLPKALAALRDSPHISEAVVLSTCLRTEIYAVVERFHDGVADIEAFFRTRAGRAADDLDERLFVAYDEAAATHLFEVAAGIDSAVLGEGEVLRQVRCAADVAREEHADGPFLRGLFRHAVEVGKRSRAETAIARGTVSLAHVAVSLVAEHLGSALSGSAALLVGLGEMGEGMARALAGRDDAPSLTVATCVPARVAERAETLGARAVGLGDLGEALIEADAVLTSTAAGEPLLTATLVAGALHRRDGRPLLVVDVAVPRDVEPAVGELPGVTLLDMDDLRAFAEAQMAGRRDEVGHVQEIIGEELERYRRWVAGRSADPVVASLRNRAEAIRRAEIERHRQRLAGLDDTAREAVESLTRGIIAKLLHEPTVRVKDAAGSPRGERLAEALRALFDL